MTNNRFGNDLDHPGIVPKAGRRKPAAGTGARLKTRGFRSMQGAGPLLGLAYLHDDPAFDLSPAHGGKRVIDVFQSCCMHRRFHLTCHRKIDGFLQVLAGAYDGTPDGVAVEDGIEDGQIEIAGRQAVQADRPFAPQGGQPLYTVTPAQMIGAIATKSMPEGNLATYRASATTYSA